MKKSLAISFLVLLASTSLAFADFIDLPVKWSQPIGYDTEGKIIGVDRLSDHTVNVVMADDFISDGRPITAVRWWGSYIGVSCPKPNGFTGPFDISFHLSTGPHPFSLPGSALYLVTVPAQEVFVGFDQAGDAVYRYDAYLPTPFFEERGVEYFLDIDKPTDENWGWHDSKPPHPILDWAAVAPTHAGPWATFIPETDLAFELLTVPEPATIIMLGSGLLSLLGFRRRFQK